MFHLQSELRTERKLFSSISIHKSAKKLKSISNLNYDKITLVNIQIWVNSETQKSSLSESRRFQLFATPPRKGTFLARVNTVNSPDQKKQAQSIKVITKNP